MEDDKIKILEDESFNEISPQDNQICEEKISENKFLKTVTTVLFVFLSIFSMYLFRDYIHAVLVWVEQEPPWLIVFIFTLLFTLVSLPLAWGYIVINMAAGYLFGVLYGLLVTIVSATLGVVFAHYLIKFFFSGFVRKLMNSSEYSKALLTVLSGSQAFKLVALSRLTPVPHGLQNSIFAVSNLSVSKYVVSSMLGLLPSQIINAYIGSTLRSMEEVLYSEETVWKGWILLGVQLILSLLVGLFIVRRAKIELNASLLTENESA
ncbi:transmembrane protein 64 [Eurytemora carolleeae]|uniref:transmembrane protein 64 n=1 Tax=Eurytemora carolleeae TaxID=1294199 RepID=UPI000C7695CF|nr:transmembrane protein 64 [Eurytemora carolleeae]|eukprot:XP_023323220.1 transmembrane protein 64-like [Eurytemora affinis]